MDRDEQREAELAFSETLRQKAREGRPRLEDLLDRGEASSREDEEDEQE